MTVFDVTLEELRDRTSMKWRAYPPDVLPLFVAESDARPAPAVVEAVNRAMALGDTGYPIGQRYEAAMASFAHDRWGWDFDPATQAVPVPDVMQGIVAVLDHLGQPGAPVVINPPVYPQFYKYLEWAGRPIIEVPLTAEGRLDFDGLGRAFSGEGGAKPDAFLLCNPHNPHGTLATREELTALVALAQQHGVRLVSDEIHGPLVLPGHQLVPLLSIEGITNAVTVTSASKSWNLAGLKGALAIGSPDVAERLFTLPDEVTHSISHIGVIAHEAALDHGREWLDEMLAEVVANQKLLVSLLAEQVPAVAYAPGPSTYLAWVDCSALGLPDPGEHFLTHGKVAFNNGGPFGPGGEQFVRINLATSPEIITEAVRRMASTLGS
ncbi:MalY/PatB family protein [Parenemella sanctibonifatiensis]|nr:aminotransferase class I/II-fold pyridoxal phosphate-dependent enzyme [Parenemella sanctibonifatiensis]